jgi:ABC-type transporter Mla subunit MlaD
MMSTQGEQHAVRLAAELERPLLAVESQLAALARSIHGNDLAALDSAANGLHAALAAAVDHFGHAARHGGVPAPLRHRLALAGGQVAAQREALARATANLDRAIDVLLQRQPGPKLYSAAGATDRAAGRAGSLLA